RQTPAPPPCLAAKAADATATAPPTGVPAPCSTRHPGNKAVAVLVSTPAIAATQPTKTRPVTTVHSAVFAAIPAPAAGCARAQSARRPTPARYTAVYHRPAASNAAHSASTRPATKTPARQQTGARQAGRTAAITPAFGTNW